MATEAIENPNPRKPHKSEKIETTGWESLPRDLLLRIFSKLAIEEILVGAPLACRDWYAASFEPSLYKDLDIENWDRIVDRLRGRKPIWIDDLLSVVVQRGGEAIESVRFVELLVAGCNFAGVAYRCPNLKFFYLRSPIMISTEAFCYAIRQWKNLEGMDVDVHSLKQEILEAIHSCCKNFLSLRVAGKLSIINAYNIVRYLPKLKSLDLSSTKFLQDTLLVILKGCKQLESLDITGVGILGMEPEVQKLAAGLKSFKSDVGTFKWESQWPLICEGCDGRDCFGSCPEYGDQYWANNACVKRSLSSDGESDCFLTDDDDIADSDDDIADYICDG